MIIGSDNQKMFKFARRNFGSVVQWIEYQISALRVRGSSPLGVTKQKGRVFIHTPLFYWYISVVLGVKKNSARFP